MRQRILGCGFRSMLRSKSRLELLLREVWLTVLAASIARLVISRCQIRISIGKLPRAEKARSIS